jgi:uncharacterized protein (DUF302 family)
MKNLGISKSTELPYDKAVVRVTEELKKEGFGVLTSIDVHETFRKKLDVDFPRYVILGACNPPLAHRALRNEEQLGLVLPCNVIVYEKDGLTQVSAFDPTAMVGILDNPEMDEIASDVKTRMQRVIAAV